MARRKRFSAEFKRQALRRAAEPGMTDALVCEQLGVSTRQLRRWKDAVREHGEEEACGRHRVARLMRKDLLKGCPKRRFIRPVNTPETHPVADNLIKQDFTADKPNRRWASDITQVWTRQGWLYLSVATTSAISAGITASSAA